MNPDRRIPIAFVLLCLVAMLAELPTASAQTKSRVVELHIYSAGRSQVGSQQKWMEMLSRVNADRVISGSGSLPGPAIDTEEFGGTSMIIISGVLKNNQLLLPIKKFSIRDQAGITSYIQALRDDGVHVALSDKKAFGLTSEQLVDVYRRLSPKVNFDTTGLSIKNFADKLLTGPTSPFIVSKSVQGILNSDATIKNEWHHLSLGTAASAILRPLNLSIVPQQLPGKPVELLIVESRDAKEFWPVGWPIERSPVSTEPRLFERLDIEIRDYALRQVLDAIQKRCQVPFLYDSQSVTETLQQTKVSLVQKRASYMVAIDKVLRQTKPKLSQEVRADENGTPFLWVTARE